MAELANLLWWTFTNKQIILFSSDWDRSFKRPSPPPSPPAAQMAVSHPRRQHHHHTHSNSPRISNVEEVSGCALSDENEEAVQRLAQQLHAELKESKKRHLDCAEVLLPTDLLQRIAGDMLEKSEKEPCGIRGCTIFIEFQEEPNNVRRIASLKPDQDCVSTFEFYLTLNSQSSWTSKLPTFLKWVEYFFLLLIYILVERITRWSALMFPVSIAIIA